MVYYNLFICFFFSTILSSIFIRCIWTNFRFMNFFLIQLQMLKRFIYSMTASRRSVILQTFVSFRTVQNEAIKRLWPLTRLNHLTPVWLQTPFYLWPTTQKGYQLASSSAAPPATGRTSSAHAPWCPCTERQSYSEWWAHGTGWNWGRNIHVFWLGDLDYVQACQNKAAASAQHDPQYMIDMNQVHFAAQQRNNELH